MKTTGILLHFGGAGTYTVAFMISVTFLLIFIVSFTFGRLPTGSRRLSRKWLSDWLKASLPRLAAAGAFSAAFFIASSLSGSSSSGGGCDKVVAPLTTQAVTAPRLQSAVAAMRQVTDSARAGDLAGASSHFFDGDTHNVTHDIDPPLRAADAALAKQLCLSVVALELQFPGKRDLGVITAQAQASADLLERAGQALKLSQ